MLWDWVGYTPVVVDAVLCGEVVEVVGHHAVHHEVRDVGH